ncbi:hypothetical protein [Paenibacillus massiliensis]|uniref:hypothetical protein n=1 Tax=Paenibacillus massiliensis TaxID=225917 RepID=UPI00035FE541|nr:hypothetical protein [Paenibacillus massiliensis]
MQRGTNWRRKLSSRKFWALLAGLVTSILSALGYSESIAIRVTGIITAAGSVIAYILAEAYIDGKHVESQYMRKEDHQIQQEEHPSSDSASNAPPSDTGTQ